VIQGPSAVIGRSLFPFGRTERYFLLAEFLFGCSWLILAIPVLAARSAFRGFNHDLHLAAGLLLLWTFVAIVVCVVRLLFLFPAIATDSYRGLATAWKQTRGYFETLAVLYTIVRLPYLLMIAALDGLVEPYSPYTLKAAITSAQCIVYLLNEAAVVGMLAMVYECLIGNSAQPVP
jgi:hypothetical protein